MDLLLTMANELPNVSKLESYLALHQGDPEHDFFNNIVHVQVSRMYIFSKCIILLIKNIFFFCLT